MRAGLACDMGDQFRGRLLGARIDAHRGRCGAREILRIAPAVSGGHSNVCSCICGQAVYGAQEFRRRQIQLGGVQNRPMAVVAQLLVAFDDAAPQRVHRGGGIVDVDQQLAGGKYSNRCDVRSKNSGRKYSMPPGAMPALTSR